jgi:hypothetical protein
LDEVQKDSGQAPAWLVEVWQFYGGKVTFDVLADDWPGRYPDLVKLLTGLDRTLVDAFPNKSLCDERGEALAFTVKVLPRGLQLLKGQPRQVHRQVAVDGQRIDLRTMVGHVIATPYIENLADACRIWLADLQKERKATARRKVRILLSRAIGIRGQELQGFDPALKARIMQALAGERIETTGERQSG